MALTPDQITTLGTYIAADAELSVIPNTEDGAQTTADILNTENLPSFTVWKTSAQTEQIMNAINGVSLAALQTAESNVLISVIAAFQNSGLDPSVSDKRQLFDDLFAGAANNNGTTRANLLALWKRLATEGEQVYATGTGSDADPADLVVEGDITRQEVFAARNP